ncbi:MAG: TPM domain-containing protein [Leptospira sp.]|nr:TPM domain-containing protein [Leptospira sp.]
MFKQTKFVITAVLFLITIKLFADSIPSQPFGYITDLTQTIDQTTISNLNTIAKQLEEKHGHPVYVLISNSLDGKDLEEESIAIAEMWKIGNKEQDDGIIILFFIEDRRVRIEVGYGLEAIVTDLKAKEIIREVIIPRMKNQDLVGAITNSFKVFDTIFSGESDISSLVTRFRLEERNSFFSSNLLYFVIFGVSVFGFFVWMKKRQKHLFQKRKFQELQNRIEETLQFLSETNPFWIQSKQRYNIEMVETKRKDLLDDGNRIIELWKKNPEEETRLIFWFSDVEKVQKRPKDVFQIDFQRLDERLHNIWKDLPWKEWESQFSIESVTETKKIWENKKEDLLKSKNLSELNKFIERIKANIREPRLSFYPEWSVIFSDTKRWLDDEKIWEVYNKKYEKKLVSMYRDLALKKLEEWTVSPPTHYEEKLRANRFWITNIVSIRDTPDTYFTDKRSKSEMIAEADAIIIANQTYRYSNSSTGYSSSSSSSGRGGSFGGGGASGSW